MDTELLLAVRNRILALCGERDITVNKLADSSGLPPTALKTIVYRTSKTPHIATIKKICDGLDITLGDFFSTPEFDALEQEIQ